MMRSRTDVVVGVGHETDLAAEALFHDRVERLDFVGTRHEIAVEPPHRQLVVVADTDGVRFG